MCSPKSLHNLQHDEGGNYMAETEKGITLEMTFYIPICILYSSCHRHWIVSLVIFGIVYAHVQFTLGNFNTLVLLIGGRTLTY